MQAAYPLLLAEDAFPTRPRDFHVGFSLQQDDQGEAVCEDLRSQLHLHFFEVAKALRLWQARQLPATEVKLGAWLGFLADPSNQAVAEACMTLPDLKEAKDVLEELSAEDDAREIARLREKARLDWTSMMEDARSAGEARGRAEGEARGRAEGEARGRADGLEEKGLAILRALLAASETKNLPDVRLAELTGLTVADVARVRRSA